MISKLKNFVVPGLKILLAVAFLMAGAAKLSGAEEMIAMYDQIGFGQWFRYLTGILEVTAAIGLLIPRTSLYASALLICVMIGAVVTHLFLIGGSAIPAIVLGSLCSIITYTEIPKTQYKDSF